MLKPEHLTLKTHSSPGKLNSVMRAFGCMYLNQEKTLQKIYPGEVAGDYNRWELTEEIESQQLRRLFRVNQMQNMQIRKLKNMRSRCKKGKTAETHHGFRRHAGQSQKLPSQRPTYYTCMPFQLHLMQAFNKNNFLKHTLKQYTINQFLSRKVFVI